MTTCGICERPDVSAVDAMLSAGSSLRTVARQFGVSRSALDRHREHTPPVAVPLVLSVDAQVHRDGAGVGVGVLALAHRFAVQIEQTMARLETSALDDVARSRAFASLSSSLVRLAELTGERVEMTDEKIIALPRFRRLLDKIYSALEAHPDAYAAVLAVLKPDRGA